MTTAAYTGSAPPGNKEISVLRPQLSGWVARLWQIGTTNESVPMLKLSGSIDPRRIENRDLAETLRPVEAGLRNVSVYLEHTQTEFGAPWSVGLGAVDQQSSSFFLGKFMTSRIGPVIGALIGGSTGRVDLSIGVVPIEVSGSRVRFLVTDYDIGAVGRLS
ncbi:hypothetical protein [Hyphomicrobium sp.]|uniref:hypothetical protein n=1 Tax=Hyphomicrobium sp. TaxID=82 RepID=UPI0025BC8AA7|nr:hypothetical protein [Hyphomicrobium sp.]MCC7250616.1 hypothetical protein [Hyphomicrobium sp.]